MKIFSSFVLSLFAFALSAPLAHAVSPVPYTEGVSFSFRITGVGNGIMTVYDESGSPAVGQTTYNVTTESASGTAWLRPGKKYTVSFGASGPWEYFLSYIAPDGYQIFINDVPSDLSYRNTGGGEYTYYYQIELRPVANSARADAGSFSGFDLGKSVTWEVGLGGLRTGHTAGRIIFKELDLAAKTPANRARLYYSTPANTGQITAVYDGASNQTLRQIMAPQAFVNLTDLTTNPDAGYSISFYAPSQATLSGASYTVTGSPWRVIKVETPGTSQLKITETEGTVSRVSLLALGSGSVPTGTYVWNLQEGDGTTVLRTTTQTGTVSTGFREVLAEVRTGGSTGTVVARTKYHYEHPASGTADWGEEVTQVTSDPTGTAPLTKTFTYHIDPTAPGNYRKVKTVTETTGNWASYLHYDDWNRRGQLAVDSHPFANTPGTATAAATNVGNSTIHDYTADFTGRFRLESSTEHRTTDIRTGLALTTPTINQVQDGQIYPKFRS